MIGMYRDINRMIVCLSTVLMLSSCLTENFAEKDPVLSIDVQTLEVPGDLVSGESVVDSVIVRSNRSWNAQIVPSVDWAEADILEFEDLAGVMTEVPIRLTFKDNDTDHPRVANLVVTTDSGISNVKLVQQPLQPRLSPDMTAEGLSIHYEGGEAVVDVKSNVDWTASIIEKSENASVILELVDTEQNGNVKVVFNENFDLQSEAYVVLNFTASGFTPVTMRLTQQAATAYARILEVTGGEDILASIGGKRNILVKSNVNWTVGIKDSAAENVTFSKTSGGRGETSVTMYFEGNPDFDSRREFIAQFVTEVPGVDDGTNAYEFTQERGSLHRYVFSYNGTWYWPFLESRPSLSVGSPNFSSERKSFTTRSGHLLTVFSKYGVWLNNTRGINLGLKENDSAGDYIEFPAIEGRRLVKVTWQTAGGATRSGNQIVEADNPANIVGPEIFASCQTGDLRIWELTATEAGKAYRIESTRDQTMQTPALECYYE